MSKVAPKKNHSQEKPKSVKLVRDMRGIPATAYRLSTDGRKWKATCAERKQIADWLATYGDGDGSRIFPKIETVLAAFDTWSRATIFRRLKELRKLGVLQSEGRKGESGPRVRKLIPAALKEPQPVQAEVSDTTSEVSDSQNEPKAEVSNRKPEVSDSRAEVSISIETQTVTRPSHAVRCASAVDGDSGVGSGFAFDFDFTRTNANCYTVTDAKKFETFWQLYPRKLHEFAARRALQKLNPSRSLAEKILFDVHRRLNSKLHVDSWKSRDLNFLPFPENYLRARLWQDGDTPFPETFDLACLGPNARTIRNAENLGSLPKGTFWRILRVLEKRGTDFDNDPDVISGCEEYWRRIQRTTGRR